MEILGYLTLIIFLGLMLLTLFGYIRTPVQTVLVLSTVLCLIVGGIFRYAYWGWDSVMLLPNEFLGGIILHPITALLTGLFLAGGLKASGGFEALKVLLGYLRRSPIGLVGTLVVLINLPVISSLPCGRILAAALLPLLFTFGFEGGLGLLTKSQLIVLIGAFTRNAMGSCGPSPIGGVGQIGEGFLGSHFATASDGILRAPQAFALMMGTAIVALFLKFVSQRLYPNDVSLRDSPLRIAAETEPEIIAPTAGYLALVIFVLSLLVAIFQPFGKMPVQTVLVVGALVMIVVCRIRLQDLMEGIILLPVTAMAAGFLAAGALAATGGFDALGVILNSLVNVPFLGIAGMLAIFVQFQTILPLSCARILVAALVPVLYLFGPAKFAFLDWSQLAIMMAAFIINATTSCGPSPLGGGGMMGEGTMRAETGFIKGAYTFASMAIMAPLAAIYMKFLNLAVFEPGNPAFMKDIIVIGEFTLAIVGVNVLFIFLGSKLFNSDSSHNFFLQLGGFILSGAITGGIIAFSLFELDSRAILQGIAGGTTAAALIALMVPARLSARMSATLTGEAIQGVR
ncbi:hypothetical protein [Desulfomonile tiedjei]|uniref:Uncharacterized protein n=1 Tax=Desulfomonile tiedjei (strain ATCC 49306 / DSM 6799 / DCB-1) TaxID=706587 RepID=I4CC51_DESTA|nr:hypothetical protein [Desulfomonile tiedjei]AFM27142.1 hypothetical protein Desti_4511 [Desulfomonile tiedjei DSM 6799]